MQFIKHLRMKGLVLTIFLFFYVTVNLFTPNIPNNLNQVYFVGSINLYINTDGLYFINYEGKLPMCFTKTIINQYRSCDTFNLEEYIETLKLKLQLRQALNHNKL